VPTQGKLFGRRKVHFKMAWIGLSNLNDLTQNLNVKINGGIEKKPRAIPKEPGWQEKRTRT